MQGKDCYVVAAEFCNIALAIQYGRYKHCTVSTGHRCYNLDPVVTEAYDPTKCPRQSYRKVLDKIAIHEERARVPALYII